MSKSHHFQGFESNNVGGEEVHHKRLTFVVRSIQHDGEMFGRERSGKSVWISNSSVRNNV